MCVCVRVVHSSLVVSSARAILTTDKAFHVFMRLMLVLETHLASWEHAVTRANTVLHVEGRLLLKIYEHPLLNAAFVANERVRTILQDFSELRIP